jgi:hypothetical protein
MLLSGKKRVGEFEITSISRKLRYERDKLSGVSRNLFIVELKDFHY